MDQDRLEYAEANQGGKRRSSLGALSKSKPVAKFKTMFEAKGPVPKIKDSGLLGKLKPLSASLDTGSFATALSGSMASLKMSIGGPLQQSPPTPIVPLSGLPQQAPAEPDVLRHPSPLRSVEDLRLSSPVYQESFAHGSDADARKSPGSAGFLKRMSSSLKRALTPKSSTGKQKADGFSPSYAGSDASNLSPRPSAQLLMTPSSQPSSTSLDLNCRSDQTQPPAAISPSALMGYDVHIARDCPEWARSCEGGVDSTFRPISRPPRSPCMAHPPSGSVPDVVSAQHEASLPIMPRDVSPRPPLPASPDQSQVCNGIALAPGALTVAEGKFVSADGKGPAVVPSTHDVTPDDRFAASLTAIPTVPDCTDGPHASPPMREVNMDAVLFSSLQSASNPGTDACNILADLHADELVFPSLLSSGSYGLAIRTLEAVASQGSDGPCSQSDKSADVNMGTCTSEVPIEEPQVAVPSSEEMPIAMPAATDTEPTASSMDVDSTTQQEPVLKQPVPLAIRRGFGAARSFNLDLSGAVNNSQGSPDNATPTGEGNSLPDSCIVGLTPVRPDTAAICSMNVIIPSLSTVAEGSPEASPPAADLPTMELENNFRQAHIAHDMDVAHGPSGTIIGHEELDPYDNVPPSVIGDVPVLPEEHRARERPATQSLLPLEAVASQGSDGPCSQSDKSADVNMGTCTSEVPIEEPQVAVPSSEEMPIAMPAATDTEPTASSMDVDSTTQQEPVLKQPVPLAIRRGFGAARSFNLDLSGAVNNSQGSPDNATPTGEGNSLPDSCIVGLTPVRPDTAAICSMNVITPSLSTVAEGSPEASPPAADLPTMELENNFRQAHIAHDMDVAYGPSGTIIGHEELDPYDNVPPSVIGDVPVLPEEHRARERPATQSLLPLEAVASQGSDGPCSQSDKSADVNMGTCTSEVPIEEPQVAVPSSEEMPIAMPAATDTEPTASSMDVDSTTQQEPVLKQPVPLAIRRGFGAARSFNLDLSGAVNNSQGSPDNATPTGEGNSLPDSCIVGLTPVRPDTAAICSMNVITPSLSTVAEGSPEASPPAADLPTMELENNFRQAHIAHDMDVAYGPSGTIIGHEELDPYDNVPPSVIGDVPVLPEEHRARERPATQSLLPLEAVASQGSDGPCSQSDKSADVNMGTCTSEVPIEEPQVAVPSSEEMPIAMPAATDTEPTASSMDVDSTTQQEPVLKQPVPLAIRRGFGAARSFNLDLSGAVNNSQGSPDNATPTGEGNSLPDSCIVGLTPVRPDTAAICSMNVITPSLSTVAEGSPEASPPAADLPTMELENNFRQAHIAHDMDVAHGPSGTIIGHEELDPYDNVPPSVIGDVPVLPEEHRARERPATQSLLPFLVLPDTVDPVVVGTDMDCADHGPSAVSTTDVPQQPGLSYLPVATPDGVAKPVADLSAASVQVLSDIEADNACSAEAVSSASTSPAQHVGASMLQEVGDSPSELKAAGQGADPPLSRGRSCISGQNACTNASDVSKVQLQGLHLKAGDEPLALRPRIASSPRGCHAQDDTLSAAGSEASDICIQQSLTQELPTQGVVVKADAFNTEELPNGPCSATWEAVAGTGAFGGQHELPEADVVDAPRDFGAYMPAPPLRTGRDFGEGEKTIVPGVQMDDSVTPHVLDSTLAAETTWAESIDPNVGEHSQAKPEMHTVCHAAPVEVAATVNVLPDIPVYPGLQPMDTDADLMDLDSSGGVTQLRSAPASPGDTVDVVDVNPACKLDPKSVEVPVSQLLELPQPSTSEVAKPHQSSMAPPIGFPSVAEAPVDSHAGSFSESVDLGSVTGAAAVTDMGFVTAATAPTHTLQSPVGVQVIAPQSGAVQLVTAQLDNQEDDPMMVSPMPQRWSTLLTPVLPVGSEQIMPQAFTDFGGIDAAASMSKMPDPATVNSPDTSRFSVRAFQLHEFQLHVEPAIRVQAQAYAEMPVQDKMTQHSEQGSIETPDALAPPLQSISSVTDSMNIGTVTHVSIVYGPVDGSNVTSTGDDVESAVRLPTGVPTLDLIASVPSVAAPPPLPEGDDVPMADSLEAIEALWGNDNLLEEPGSATAEGLMPQIASSPVSTSKQAESHVLSQSGRKVAPGVVLQVERESLDLFSLRNSCASRVSDSLMVESLESFESMGLCVKGRGMGFVPMAPLKEGDEDAAVAGRTSGSDGGSGATSAGPPSPNVTFPVNTSGSPDSQETPGINTVSIPANKPAACSLGRRDGVSAAAAGGMVKAPGSASKAATPAGAARANATPSTALKALGAANAAGASASKACVSKRFLPVAVPQPRQVSTPGQQVAVPSGPSPGSRLPGFAATPAAGANRAPAPTPGFKPPMPSASAGAAPAAVPGRPGVTPQGGAISSGKGQNPVSGICPPGLLLVHQPAAMASPEGGLFDTPVISHAAPVPLADTPFPASDFDLDTVDISAEASKAIALLGGRDTSTAGAAAQHATPELEAIRGAAVACTPTMCVFETHVQLLTSKLAEAEDNINQLQNANAMLRDQLSTLQFKLSMTNDLDMERDAREYLEHELSTLRQQAVVLEADVRAAHAKIKRHEQAAVETLAAQQSKEVEWARKEVEMEQRMQQMASEVEAARSFTQQVDARIAAAEARAAAATAKCDDETARSRELQVTLGLQAHQLVQVQRSRDDAEAKFQRAMEQLITTQTSHKKAVIEFEQKLLHSSNLASQINDVRDKYRQMKQHAANADQRAQHAEAKAQETANALAKANMEKAELMQMCNELLTQLEATKVKGGR
ncbi:hypothetical protein VaNZ11_002232 [Volvox africanus]|uniref:Uncharacterized protein n=1 Tax=Volvox africanus TaxID=51714 RepID=A0ABQ5RRK5_9CHLO|nr:hypothetical protein VaNZ11_002232 [Volvox africanus]